MTTHPRRCASAAGRISVGLAAAFAVPEPARTHRLRELRMAARLLLGPRHPVVSALATAIADPGALDAALAELERLPALPRRRLLCTLAAVLP